MNCDRSHIEEIFHQRVILEKIDFKEQVPIRNIDKKLVPKYHLDFVFFQENVKIAVELDGQRFHKDSKSSDVQRDLMVISNGYDDILRFSGTDIMHGLDAVIAKVKETLDFHINLKNRAFQRSSFKLNDREIATEEGFEVVKTVKGSLAAKWLNSDLKHPSNRQYFLDNIESKLQSIGYLVGNDVSKQFHESIRKRFSSDYMMLPFQAYGKRFIVLLDTTRMCKDNPGYLTASWFESEQYFMIVVAVNLRLEIFMKELKVLEKIMRYLLHTADHSNQIF